MRAQRSSLWTEFALTVALIVVQPNLTALAAEEAPRRDTTSTYEIAARRELVTAAYEWLDATLARDFAAQSAFYPERMDAFYLWRDVPKAAVLAEKRRVFKEAGTLNIRIEPPQILMDSSARSGRMYFRKTYDIKGQINRTGEVLQELRWTKEEDGWKIVSERDLRVIRQTRRER